jgi:hypothetical protein
MTWFLDFPSLQKHISETAFLLLCPTQYKQFGTQFSAPKPGEMIGKQIHKLSFELQLNTLYPEDRNRYNFRNTTLFLEHHTMTKLQNPSNLMCNIPLSDPYRSKVY